MNIQLLELVTCSTPTELATNWSVCVHEQMMNTDLVALGSQHRLDAYSSQTQAEAPTDNSTVYYSLQNMDVDPVTMPYTSELAVNLSQMDVSRLPGSSAVSQPDAFEWDDYVNTSM
jgi:hypothetical protein